MILPVKMPSFFNNQNKYYRFFCKSSKLSCVQSIIKNYQRQLIFSIFLLYKRSNNTEHHYYWLLFIYRWYINNLIYKPIINFMTQWIKNWISMVWGNYLVLFCDDYLFIYTFFYYKHNEIFKTAIEDIR